MVLLLSKVKGDSMKYLILSAIALIATTAFAGEPSYEELASSTVKSMYGRGNDTVTIDLITMVSKNKSYLEVWRVGLRDNSNGATAIYEVNINQNHKTEVGDEVATIKVKLVDAD